MLALRRFRLCGFVSGCVVVPACRLFCLARLAPVVVLAWLLWQRSLWCCFVCVWRRAVGWFFFLLVAVCVRGPCALLRGVLLLCAVLWCVVRCCGHALASVFLCCVVLCVVCCVLSSGAPLFLPA